MNNKGCLIKHKLDFQVGIPMTEKNQLKDEMKEKVIFYSRNNIYCKMQPIRSK